MFIVIVGFLFQTGPADSAKRSAVVDDDDDDIDFEAMFNLPKRQATSETSNEPAKEESNTTKPKDKNIKLSRYVPCAIILSCICVLQLEAFSGV